MNQSNITTTGDTSATDLADAINREHHKAQSAARDAVEHAIEAGRLLNEAKTTVGHGNWSAWLNEHFEASERTARAYMRLAKHKPEIDSKRQHAAVLSIRDAIGLIAEPACDTEDADVGPDYQGVPGDDDNAEIRLADLPMAKNDVVAVEETAEKHDRTPKPKSESLAACMDMLPEGTDPVAAGLQCGKEFDRIARAIVAHFKEAEEVGNGWGGMWLDQHKLAELKAKLQNAAQVLRDTKPHVKCGYCKGNGCPTCRESGYLPKLLANDVPSEPAANASA